MKKQTFRPIKKVSKYILLAFTMILLVSCKKDNDEPDTNPDQTTEEVDLSDEDPVVVDENGNEVPSDGDSSSGDNSSSGTLAYKSDVDRRTTDSNVLNPTVTDTDKTTVKEHDSAETLNTNALSFKIGTAKWTASQYNIAPLSDQHDLLEITLSIKNTANKTIVVTREDLIASYMVNGKYPTWFNTLLTSKYDLPNQFEDSFELAPGKSASGSLFFEFPKDLKEVTLRYTELYGNFTVPTEYEMIVPIQ